MADTTDKDIKQAETELEQFAKRYKVVKEQSQTISDLYANILQKSQQLSVEELKYIEDKKRSIDLLKQAAEARRENLADLEEEVKLAKEGVEKQQKIVELLKAKLLEQKKTGKLGSVEERQLEEEYKKQKDILKNLKEQQKTKEKIKEVGDSLTGGLFSQIKGYFTLEGQLKNISDIFTSIMDGNAEYARTTGQIADRTVTFGLGAASFGIGFEKMNKAAMNLYTSMSGFSELNKEIQENLSLSAAKLENLGISAEVSGRNMDVLMKTFKMTASEAISTNEELARAAIGAGIAPSKMLAGFAESMPRLAAYGKQAIQVYTDLQKQAKSLGLEVSNLTNIVGDQMDTFEGAARAAGKFNAVMGGGYLNSIELLNATESERVVILKRAFEQTGKNFDSLSKFEKKAIAATLGISDLNDATKLFSKSSSELAMDQAKNAVTQEKLEAVQKEAAKTIDQVKEAFNSLMIVIRPLVYIVKQFINLLSWFADLGGGIGGIVLNIAAAFFLFGKSIKSGFSAISSFVTRLLGLGTTSAVTATEVAASAPVISTSTATMGAAAGSAALQILALGGALLFIGGGIYLAATGIGNLVESFKGLNAEQIAGASVALLGFGVAIGLLVIKLMAISVPAAGAIGLLLAIGGAIAFIGTGIGIAAAGIGSLVTSFGVFVGEKGVSIAENISATTGALVTMITTLTGVGAVGLLAIGGITVAVSALVEELNKIPEGKVLSLETFDNTLKTVKTLKDSDLEPTRKFVTVVKDYYTEQAKSKDADKDAFVVALREVMGEFNKGAAATGTEGGTIPIKLVIADGKEFAASIVESAGSPRLATALGGRTPSRRGF